MVPRAAGTGLSGTKWQTGSLASRLTLRAWWTGRCGGFFLLPDPRPFHQIRKVLSETEGNAVSARLAAADVHQGDAPFVRV